MRKFVIGGTVVVALTFAVTLTIALNVTFHKPTHQSFPAFNSNLVYRSPKASPISRMHAIRAAASVRYRGLKNIAQTTRISARFGAYSNNTMCRETVGSNECRLLYQHRIAWVITFRGPQMCAEGGIPPHMFHGRLVYTPPPTLTPAQASRCVMRIVIDGRTGKALEGFN
jgi:hypothetical protein